MDFQPQNVHVRDAKRFGYEQAWPEDARVFAYLSTHTRQRAFLAGEQPHLMPGFWVTPWGLYSPEEAAQVLALPGSLPTHKVEFTLLHGTIVEGPAWIAPYPMGRVRTRPDLPRHGNGIEVYVPDVLEVGHLDPVVSTWDDQGGAWRKVTVEWPRGGSG